MVWTKYNTDHRVWTGVDPDIGHTRTGKGTTMSPWTQVLSERMGETGDVEESLCLFSHVVTSDPSRSTVLSDEFTPSTRFTRVAARVSSTSGKGTK